MNKIKKWLKDPVFIKLCDIVAKNNLVCLTGAGVSKGLKLKSGELSPDWKQLLLNIQNESRSKLTQSERNDLTELLSDNASGEQLIEAASILCKKNEKKFIKALSDSVDLQDKETSETHKALLKLQPKGILTYNYDEAHENSIKLNNKIDEWNIVLPSDSSNIIKLLQNNLNEQFLLKMHGSIHDKKSMILTRESYRNLFIKYPFYKAFVQQIFTNFNLLIIGFGFSDPDFEMLLQNVFSTFGSPIQEHIVIRHFSQKSPNDIVYKRRYGLNFLYVDNFHDIPEILHNSMSEPGNILDDILKKCTSDEFSVRVETHDHIRKLSRIGQDSLANMLESIIKNNISIENTETYCCNRENSEYVYTYGVIASVTKNKNYLNFLINEVIEKSIFSEPVAHALIHVRDILEPNDLATVERWLNVFKNKTFKFDPKNTDPHNRVYKYCEATYYLIKAKYQI